MTSKLTEGPVATPAAWLALNPCPAWCDADGLHKDIDDDVDRTHTGFDQSLFLTLGDPFPSEGPISSIAGPGDRLDVSLYQHYQEASPRVWVGVNGTPKGLYLSLNEAKRLAGELLNRVEAAEGTQS